MMISWPGKGAYSPGTSTASPHPPLTDAPLPHAGGTAGAAREPVQVVWLKRCRRAMLLALENHLFIREYMEIIDLLRSHAGDIKARFAVKRIGLFGSYARGEQKSSSDIDILVEFEKPTFRNFMDLSFYLEDLFGREVDLVTIRGLHSRIRPYVEKDVIWSE
jgi:uncharacterized protein